MSRGVGHGAHDMLSRESGAIIKPAGGGRISICLAYPNTYHVGMSSLGFHAVYSMLNAMANVSCERTFLPDPVGLDELKRTGKRLLSIEHQRQLAEFDIIAFSLSFENDYPNVLDMLALGGLPPLRIQRSLGNRFPLVIAGGVCTMSNPEPMTDFIECFLIGEAEGLLDEFVDAYSTARDEGLDTSGLLDRLSRIEGHYVPSLYEELYSPATGVIAGRRAIGDAPEVIRILRAPDISNPPARHTVTTPDTEFSSMRLVEVMRGCPWSCSFCLAGHIYDPPRRKPPEAVREELAALAPETKVGFVGPSLSDHPGMAEILSLCQGGGFSITSIRAGRQSQRLIPHLRGMHSVSMAPEAGSDRMRRAINKKITEEDIIETARALEGVGVKRLRLYFMIGLPDETDDDAAAIAMLALRIRREAFRTGHITLTVSTFVPKPKTPFERMPMADSRTIKGRLGLIKKLLGPHYGVSVSHDVLKETYLQGVLAMGDRRAGALLLEMHQRGSEWRQAARAIGLDTDRYIHSGRPAWEPLPWAFIE